jgi:hypothetical protein
MAINLSALGKFANIEANMARINAIQKLEVSAKVTDVAYTVEAQTLAVITKTVTDAVAKSELQAQKAQDAQALQAQKDAAKNGTTVTTVTTSTGTGAAAPKVSRKRKAAATATAPATVS